MEFIKDENQFEDDLILSKEEKIPVKKKFQPRKRNKNKATHQEVAFNELVNKYAIERVLLQKDKVQPENEKVKSRRQIAKEKILKKIYRDKRSYEEITNEQEKERAMQIEKANEIMKVMLIKIEKEKSKKEKELANELRAIEKSKKEKESLAIAMEKLKKSKEKSKSYNIDLKNENVNISIAKLLSKVRRTLKQDKAKKLEELKSEKTSKINIKKKSKSLRKVKKVK